MVGIGYPEGILLGLFMLALYGFLFWIVWKFYSVLSRMNENLTGIRRALEGEHRPHVG
jgi:hypothetical protein